MWSGTINIEKENVKEVEYLVGYDERERAGNKILVKGNDWMMCCLVLRERREEGGMSKKQMMCA